MSKKIIMLSALLLGAFHAYADDDSAATRALFLRGEVNNWEAPQAYQLAQASAGVMCAKADLKASHGAYKFKFADAKWKGDTTFGQFDPTAKLTLDAPVQAKSGYQWGDIRFTPAEDGNYVFCLDRSDASKFKVTVKKG